ncbi:peptide deformylase [Enterococcus avium]|uniref:peptide deformylase n=1 Tax=Enterococcus avium TaxID=33945 RepID=UPI0032E49AEE
MIKKILLLGNPDLYKISEAVSSTEDLSGIICDMHDTLINFKQTYHAGRAIAAPQIGMFKRIIYMYINNEPTIIVNPVLDFPDDETMEVLDDCMSFPNLLVKVLRHKRYLLRYTDQNWEKQEVVFEDELSELIQHEYDHLDGILATMRAKDNKSFIVKENL